MVCVLQVIFSTCLQDVCSRLLSRKNLRGEYFSVERLYRCTVWPFVRRLTASELVMNGKTCARISSENVTFLFSGFLQNVWHFVRPPIKFATFVHNTDGLFVKQKWAVIKESTGTICWLGQIQCTSFQGVRIPFRTPPPSLMRAPPPQLIWPDHMMRK